VPSNTPTNTPEPSPTTTPGAVEPSPTSTEGPTLPETGNASASPSTQQINFSLLITALLGALGFGLMLGGIWMDKLKHKFGRASVVSGMGLMVAAAAILIATVAGVPMFTRLANRVMTPAFQFGIAEPLMLEEAVSESVELEVVREESKTHLDTSEITRIVIPAINVDASVVTAPFTGDTWEVSTLGNDVGWMETTSIPGVGSNTVLAGHIATRELGNGPFVYLRLLEDGDEVFVFTKENKYVYTISGQEIVSATDSYVIAESEDAKLTLLTCTSFDRATSTYLQRRAVFANLDSVESLALAGQ
jgi:LPXTG-site transpeptidase (sortase) family protein